MKLSVYIVCEAAHEPADDIHAIRLVTASSEEANAAVLRLGEHGHFVYEEVIEVDT